MSDVPYVHLYSSRDAYLPMSRVTFGFGLLRRGAKTSRMHHCNRHLIYTVHSTNDIYSYTLSLDDGILLLNTSWTPIGPLRLYTLHHHTCRGGSNTEMNGANNVHC